MFFCFLLIFQDAADNDLSDEGDELDFDNDDDNENNDNFNNYNIYLYHKVIEQRNKKIGIKKCSEMALRSGCVGNKECLWCIKQTAINKSNQIQYSGL